MTADACSLPMLSLKRTPQQQTVMINESLRPNPDKELSHGKAALFYLIQITS